ncbi:hypothetical protein FHP29_13235 [Nocardioides albidus]|uniref:Uncharacterized protein n=1 Tax=Nocardioides albidus TaxID=1517589 RepID=A0A5C4VQM6_9ACTN|nr:hypothetical protein [Nocardioides albidus]TNM38253.1 hypothetical protein FHP29_13235 [Nocardioides albidus]
MSIWSSVHRAGGGVDSPEPLPAEAQYEPIWSDAAHEGLIAAVRKATGDTQVLHFRAYGLDEATIRTPPAEASDLAAVWLWDGSVLEEWSASAAGDDQPFDLASVDPDVLVTLDEKAREMSDGRISDSRISIAAPAYDGDDWIQLHLDEVDHGAVVLFADRDGVVAGELVNKDWRDD